MKDLTALTVEVDRARVVVDRVQAILERACKAQTLDQAIGRIYDAPTSWLTSRRGWPRSFASRRHSCPRTRSWPSYGLAASRRAVFRTNPTLVGSVCML